MRIPRPPLRARIYQDRDVAQLHTQLVEKSRVFLNYCVSGGKSPTALAVAARLFDQGQITHAVILCPSTIIEEQFTGESERQFILQDGTSIQFPHVISSEQKTLLEYLQKDNLGKLAVSCTYAAFRTNIDTIVDIAKRLGPNLLLIGDEAHHIHLIGDQPTQDDNKISQDVAKCHALGCRRLRMSGTPSRPNGKPILDEDEVCVDRPLSLHMLEGFTPATLDFELLQVEGGFGENTQQSTTGIPLDLTKAAGHILEHMASEGWPKSMIRVVAFGGKSLHEGMVRYLQDSFEKAGKKALSIYGDDAEVFANLKDYIDKEAADTPYFELPDAVITFNRGGEGSNFPSRSHLYLLGCPTSLELFEQLFGRVLRTRIKTEDGSPIDPKGEPKYPGYPAQWLNASKVVLVVAGAKTNKTIAKAVFDVAARISSFKGVSVLRSLFADGFSDVPTETPHLVVLSKEDQEKIKRYRKQILDRFRAVCAPYQETVSPILRSIELTKLIFERCKAEGNPINEKILCRTLRLEAVAENPKVYAALERKIRERKFQSRANLSTADLDSDLDEIFEEFEKTARMDDTLLRLDGELAEYVGTRLSDLKRQMRQATQESILEAVTVFRNANKGLFPDLGDKDSITGKPFSSHHAILRRGTDTIAPYSKGLPGLILERMGSQDWFSAVTEMAQEMENRLHTPDHAKAWIGSREDLRRKLIQDYSKKMPELAYYPGCFDAVLAFGEQIRPLSLEEAEKVGKAVRKSKAAGETALQSLNKKDQVDGQSNQA